MSCFGVQNLRLEVSSNRSSTHTPFNHDKWGRGENGLAEKIDIVGIKDAGTFRDLLTKARDEKVAAVGWL